MSVSTFSEVLLSFSVYGEASVLVILHPVLWYRVFHLSNDIAMMSVDSRHHRVLGAILYIISVTNLICKNEVGDLHISHM